MYASMLDSCRMVGHSLSDVKCTGRLYSTIADCVILDLLWQILLKTINSSYDACLQYIMVLHHICHYHM